MKARMPIFLSWLLLLLAACDGGRRQQMEADLERLQAWNVADSMLTNDSLAQSLVDYFDRHGTPNERLLAHFDQDYTINGVSVGGTFISRRNSGGKCDLVDWLTGDNLLQGYDSYKLVGGGASWYVIATDNASKTATVYRLNK